MNLLFIPLEPEFEFGKAIMLRQGADATLIATGGMLYN